VVAVAAEQLALALHLAVGVEALDPSHEQTGSDLLLLRLGRERRVLADLGDLRVRDSGPADATIAANSPLAIGNSSGCR
jgi:hypothetical protein